MIYEKEITGLTVKLRSVAESDAEVTYAMRADAEKVKYMHQVNGTAEDQRRYIAAQRKKPGDYLFLVTDLNGNPIGMRGIYDVTETSAESGRTIGYGDAFQNMEALLLGIDFAFDVLGVETVYMDAAADNSSVRGIQVQIGAKEYKREFLADLGYEYVFSSLSKADYAVCREKIMKLIERHAKRHAAGAEA
ncbi:MAG: GNAT family N-acetyltransferase [Oscillospiraceae bacterium]|nr:GNAT family N-acetyltransferase [Oscillospiraceae bacterium]MBR3418652.1 GNAT family N-acetyltransferase [Oscillospiraceae bacterium]